MFWSTYQTLKAVVVVMSLTFGMVNQPDLPINLSSHTCCSGESYCEFDPPCPGRQFISSSNFSLSLEWSLFKPFHGFCETELLHHQSDSTDEQHSDSLTLYELLFDMCPRDQSDHLPVCYNLTLIRELKRQKEFEAIASETPHSDYNLIFSSVIGRLNGFDYPSQPTAPIISPNLHLKELTAIDLTSIPPNKDASSSSLDLTRVVQNVYLPSPGSNSDELWYRKQLQAFLKNIVFSTFPGPWAEWINSNHPMLGITSVTLMYGSMLLPLVFAFKGRKTSRREVIEKTSTTNGCCTDLVEVKREKKRLSEKLSDAKILLKRYVEVINSQQHELSHLNEAGADIEKQFFNVSNSLSSANYQILSYQEQIKKLEENMKTQSEKMTTFASKHWGVLERMVAGVKRRQELETENELIKHAKETTITCLTTLQKKFETTKNELSDSKEKRAAMEMELCLMADKLRHHEEHLCKQEEEIEELRNCLSQVTSQTAELASLSANSSGENVKEMDQHVVDEKGDMHVQLSNVQNLLDGFQVDIDLQQSNETAKTLHKELEEKFSRMEEMSSEIEDLKEYVTLLEADYQKKSEQLNTLQLKMKGVGDYFKSKEDTLHKTLAFVEDDLKQQKVREFEAQEKLIVAEKEMDDEREEWKDLKEQLLSINESLRNQVTVSKDRADEALEQEKQTRLELQQANKEIERLKRSLTQTEKAAGVYKALPSAKAQTHLPVQRSSKVLSPCQPLHSSPARTSPGNQLSCSNLLNRNVSQPRQFFPLTQTQSTPTPTPVLKHMPSKPSPLLKASRSEPIFQSDCGLKKRVSLEQKRSSPELSIPYSTHLPGTLSGEPMPADAAVPPQCEMEDVQTSDKKAPHDTSEDSQLHSTAMETATPESMKHETTPSMGQLDVDDMRSCSRLSQLCGHWD